MKKCVFSPSTALVLALSLAGCFGGEADSPTDSKPRGGSGPAKLKPGLYVGDYTPYDTDGRGWESEFTLSEDGGFRFFWLLDNQPIGDIRGEWFQRDSNLHLGSVSETYMDNQMVSFVDSYPAEDDTSLVRDVTDSSFVRKEYTLMRQKPLWITYTRRQIPRLGHGIYRFSAEVPIDSATTDTLRIDVGLSGDAFTYKYGIGGTVSFEAEAKWAQIGSILLTYDTRARSYLDSLQDFSPWDTLQGTLPQRMDSVSATGFRLWSGEGSWDKYLKL